MKSKEFLEVSNNDTWRTCLVCNGELTQIRKALFNCLKCNQVYIGDEKDMRQEIEINKIVRLK